MIMEHERLFSIIIMLSSIFEWCCCLFFFSFVLKKRFEKKVFNIITLIAFVLIVIIKIINYIVCAELDILQHNTQILRWGSKLAVILVTFIYICLAFKSNKMKTAVVSITPILMLGMSNIVHLLIRYILFFVPTEYQIILTALFILMLNFIFFSVLSFTKKFYKKEKFIYYKKNSKVMLLIFIVSVIMLVVSGFILSFYIYKITFNELSFIIITLFFIIIMDVIIFKLIFRAAYQNRIEKENELRFMGESIQKQYTKTIKEHDNIYRRIMHDFKHHICVLDTLLNSNKIEDAKIYLKDYINATNINTYINTNNEYVNAILNSKISHAKTKGINITSVIVGEINRIDNIDICNLLGNLLDNAIDGCLLSKEKNITLKLISESDIIRISVSNSIKDSVLEYNLNLKTTKSDSKNHGLGTKTIKEIANRYNGFADFFEDSNKFFVNVILVKQNNIRTNS